MDVVHSGPQFYSTAFFSSSSSLGLSFIQNQYGYAAAAAVDGVQIKMGRKYYFKIEGGVLLFRRWLLYKENDIPKVLYLFRCFFLFFLRMLRRPLLPVFLRAKEWDDQRVEKYRLRPAAVDDRWQHFHTLVFFFSLFHKKNPSCWDFHLVALCETFSTT